jgi:SAV_6107-like HEPN
MSSPSLTTALRSAPVPLRSAPVPAASYELLDVARHGLASSSMAGSAPERYAAAHLAALRAAAAVLASRARPGSARRGPRSVWVVLPQVAPELGEWAAFFAAGAGKRASAEAGLAGVVTLREADDLLRDAGSFVALVETILGVPHQSAFPLVG